VLEGAVGMIAHVRAFVSVCIIAGYRRLF